MKRRMYPTTFITFIISTVFIVAASILFEAWLLGLILSWFSVSLTFWQNFTIILLANMIFKNSWRPFK